MSLTLTSNLVPIELDTRNTFHGTMNLERASINVSGADSEVRLEYSMSLSDTRPDPGIFCGPLKRDVKQVPRVDNVETYPLIFLQRAPRNPNTSYVNDMLKASEQSANSVLSLDKKLV